MIANRTAGVSRVVCGLANVPATSYISSAYVSRLMRFKSTASPNTSAQATGNQEYEAFKKSIPAFTMTAHNAFLDKYSKTITEDSDA